MLSGAAPRAPPSLQPAIRCSLLAPLSPLPTARLPTRPSVPAPQSAPSFTRPFQEPHWYPTRPLSFALLVLCPRVLSRPASFSAAWLVLCLPSPQNPAPPPALHSFCRSSTHLVTPLTPTGYGPQPLPLRLSPAPFPRSSRNPWPQHRAPPFLRASPTRNSAQIPPPKGPATIPPRPSEKKTRALPAPQHPPPAAPRPRASLLRAPRDTAHFPPSQSRSSGVQTRAHPQPLRLPSLPPPSQQPAASIQQHPAASLPACFSLPARYISAHAYSL